jgi:hypothetical protein
LTVNNAGDPLQSGDTFTIFNASTYAGSFSATNLPALSPGLSWSNSISGTAFTVAVVGKLKIPVMRNAFLSGGYIVFDGTNGVAAQPYRILMSTNLTLPLASWTPVTTGTFAADGDYTNSVPMNAIQSAEFFRLVVP